MGKSRAGFVVQGCFSNQPRAACCMPGIGVADVTSTTVYTPERRPRGFVSILGGEIPSEPGAFDTGGGTTGGWRGITEVTLSEGVLDKGVVTVSPPNNKQATLTLICLFCPSLYLALSRRFATLSLSFPLPFFVRRSLSLTPFAESFVFLLLSSHCLATCSSKNVKVF